MTGDKKRLLYIDINSYFISGSECRNVLSVKLLLFSIDNQITHYGFIVAILFSC